MEFVAKTGYKESSLMFGIAITGTRKLSKAKSRGYVKCAEEVLNKFVAEKGWPEEGNGREYITVSRSACYCEKRRCSRPVLFLNFNGRISVSEQGESVYSRRVRYANDKSKNDKMPILYGKDVDDLCARISKEVFSGMPVCVELITQMVSEYRLKVIKEE